MSQIKIYKIIVILLTLNQLNTVIDRGGTPSNNRILGSNSPGVLEDKIQIDEPQQTEVTTETIDENVTKETIDENDTKEITDENDTKEITDENKERVVDENGEVKDDSKEEFDVKIIMKYVFTIIFFCF